MYQMRINGHGHILPRPEQIPAFMKQKNLFWIDVEQNCMRQGEWSRPITDPSFFLDEKLVWMEKNNIDHAVMLTLSQLYCNGVNEQDCADILRFQNNFQASVQDHASGKFTCGFVVQPRYTEQARKEIARCVEELGLRMLCLPTHYLDAQGEWRSTAHEDVDPILELANHYQLAIEIHPYDGPKFIKLADQNWRFHLVWMMAQTADTLHFYTLRGIPERYPHIRTCFAHGCMLGQANLGRRMQGYRGRPDLFKDAAAPDAYHTHPNLFFDTLVHDPYTLNLLKQRVGTDQIISGLDDPYPLGEMESVPESYPGKVMDDAVKLGFFTKEEQARIWQDNVLRWLGPELTARILKPCPTPTT